VRTVANTVTPRAGLRPAASISKTCPDKLADTDGTDGVGPTGEDSGEVRESQAAINSIPLRIRSTRETFRMVTAALHLVDR
jgi:hypothetical protein